MPQAIGSPQVSSYTAPVDTPTRRSHPRARRAVFVAITALMIAIVIAGFWPYFSAAGRSDVPRPWVIHLHAAVYSGWMVLFLTQVMLVWRRRSDVHRRLGRVGIGYGVVVLLLGLVAAIVATVRHVAVGEWTLDQGAGFLLLPLGDMVLFGGLFAAGIAYRRRPEIHKRCMLLATIALMFAPAARLAGDGNAVMLLGIWMLPLLIAAANDLWTRRRVHATYIVGALVLLVAFSRVFFMESAGWLTIGRAMITAFGGSPIG